MTKPLSFLSFSFLTFIEPFIVYSSVQCVRFVSPSFWLQTKKLEMFAKESLSSGPSYLDTGTSRILSLVGKLSRGPGSFHSCYCDF